MSADPEIPFLPESSLAERIADDGLDIGPPELLAIQAMPCNPSRLPHLGHLAILLLLVLIVLLVFIVTLGTVFGVALGLHWLKQSSFDQLSRNPLFAIPVMALGEVAIFAACFPVFGLLWKLPFATGIHFNIATARKHLWLLLGSGIAIGIVVQLLSNYLPIPKSLPIDELFKTTPSVWLVAVLGVFIAPPFEELIFRGFFLPSLANAWDWMTRRKTDSDGVLPSATDPTDQTRSPAATRQWSATATIFATVLTSIAFMFIHADQLAHAWAPLAVLFSVSVLLCLVRIRTGSVAASMLVHASYNFSIFATLFLATDGFRHLEKMHG